MIAPARETDTPEKCPHERTLSAPIRTDYGRHSSRQVRRGDAVDCRRSLRVAVYRTTTSSNAIIGSAELGEKERNAEHGGHCAERELGRAA